MATDFHNSLDTTLQSETKLTTSTGKVARFSYTQQAFDNDNVAGVESYNYNQEQNIPLGDAETIQMSDTILSKGLRSQASSFTRLGINHFFGRCSYNINKLAVHLKTLFETLMAFIKEGNNAWSATTTYSAGDIVYFVTSLNGGTAKRTFICKQEATNLPPVSSVDGSLINTDYWDEIGNNLSAIKATSATINGTLSVNGDIIQNGSAYETHAEKLYTKKDTIITRDGAVSGLATGAYSGIQVKKYDGTNSCGLVVDNTGTARVGEYDPEASIPVDETQPLCTRDEAGNITNGAPLVWDATRKRAIGGSFASSPVVMISDITAVTGVAIATNYTLRIMFTADATTQNGTSDPFVINYNGTDIAVKATKNGAKVPVYAHEIVESGTTYYKYVQAYTNFDMMFDGTDFVILGNPIVLSSDDYTIYADGYYKYYKFDTTERWSGRFDADGRPIYCITNIIPCASSGVYNGITISNIQQLVSISGTFTRTDSNLKYNIPFVGIGTNQDGINAYLDSGNTVSIHKGNAWSGISTNFTLLIEYTKTTDSPYIIPPFIAP